MGLKTKIGVSLAAGAISIATAVVSYYEGYKPSAYRDPVGIPTICYGHTATARLGQTLSQTECTALLQQDLGEAFAVGSGVGQKLIYWFEDTRVDMMLAWGFSFMIIMVMLDLLVFRLWERRTFVWRHQFAT